MWLSDGNVSGPAKWLQVRQLAFGRPQVTVPPVGEAPLFLPFLLFFSFEMLIVQGATVSIVSLESEAQHHAKSSAHNHHKFLASKFLYVCALCQLTDTGKHPKNRVCHLISGLGNLLGTGTPPELPQTVCKLKPNILILA